MTAKKQQLPTMAIAKREVKEGSKEWLDKVTHDHSKTAPERLERRRLGVSAHLTTLENCIRRVQIQKKVMIASSRKMLETNRKQRDLEGEKISDPAQRKAFDAETERLMSEMNAAVESQVMQYEITIANLTGQFALIEVGCLQVDCLSMRHDVMKKGKLKWGKVRWPIASFIHDTSLSMLEMKYMIKEIFKTHVDVQTVKKVEEDLQEESIDDDEVDDEEIVTDEEAEDIKTKKKED